MVKYIVFILLLTLTTWYSKAQSNTTLSGQVVNLETKEVLPFASVAVFNSKNLLINGRVASNDGRFIIKGLGEGKYNVKVSCIGHNNSQMEILIGKLNTNYDLGKIGLSVISTELGEVVIAGKNSEITPQLDKKTFDISTGIAQSGGSVMDAMKAMPGVTFDQEGKVILRGSDKVLVLIDGKQSSLTGFGNQKGLDNIPVANIERIEIINSPSAKYDASGMAGIINIVYKNERQSGLHGSVGFSYGLGALTKPRADLPTQMGSYSFTPKYIPSLDLNLKKEKINLFLQSEVILQEKLPNNEFTTRYYNDGRITASQVPENRKQDHYIVKGGADFRFNDLNILTISGIYDWEIHDDAAQVPYIDRIANKRNRYITWNEKEITGFMNFSLRYEHKFRQPGHLLSANLQYTKGWEDETYHINDSSQVRKQGRDVTSILAIEHTSNFTIDYTKPLPSGRLEGGTKLQIRNLPVDYTQERGENTLLYPGLGSWTKWGESIYAGYFNLVHEKPRYDLEAGIRAEYTTVYYDIDPTNTYFKQNDAYDYFSLFPNVRLAYKPNERNKLSFFFNRRIDRPGEPELRMYAKSDDHELIKVGNPYLRPQFTQAVELGYKTNWRNGSIFISGYIRSILDPYMRVYTQDKTNTTYDIILKSYANTGKATNKGIELVVSQQVAKFWKFSGNMNVFQNKIFDYQGELLFPYPHQFTIDEKKDNTWDFKLINTFDLPKNIQIQLTGLYFAPKIIPQGKELSRSSIDLGLKKVVWKGKGEVTFAFTDIFNQYGIRQEIIGEGFNALYENYFETQMARLGLKYKF
jgi:outer membrane receptor protein involved in Fe transport